MTKSPCPTSNFTCPKLSGIGICRALDEPGIISCTICNPMMMWRCINISNRSKYLQVITFTNNKERQSIQQMLLTHCSWEILIILEKNIFKLILVTDGCDISIEIALRWTSRDLSDDKSTLVQVMAWCRQATSHYLNQYWPRSLPAYGVTRPQWVHSLLLGKCALFYLYQNISIRNLHRYVHEDITDDKSTVVHDMALPQLIGP